MKTCPVRRVTPPRARRSASLSATFSALGAALLTLAGCGKGGDGPGIAKNPQEAASQLDQAFAAAAPEIRQSVAAAAAAMRSGEYEKAVLNLQVVRNSQALTLDQGLAIHSSVVALETSLLNGIAAGDPGSRRAYELLKAMKRD